MLRAAKALVTKLVLSLLFSLQHNCKYIPYRVLMTTTAAVKKHQQFSRPQQPALVCVARTKCANNELEVDEKRH